MSKLRTSYRYGRSENVAIGAASVANAVMFSQNIFTLRIAPDVGCYVKVDKAPVATSSDVYVPANGVEYVDIRPGEKIAVIQKSGTGLLNITEMDA